jgi:thiosulfate dehydrogenase
MSARASVVVALLLLAAGCTTDEAAAQLGEREFSDPAAFHKSELNRFSCATCHATSGAADPARKDAGFDLHGVVARVRFWGGTVDRLDDAVSACLTYYMRQPEQAPFDPQSPEGRALWEYLLSITPDGSPSDPLPMTIVKNIAPVASGDASRGATIYAAACVRCHGAAHTGAGSIIQPSPIVLPEYATSCVNGRPAIGAGCYEQIFPGVKPGLVVVEKVRHGRFFDIGGTMPLYAVETMSDDELGDLLAFLELPSE